MAKGDVRIHRGTASVKTWQTDAGDTALLPGEPVKIKSAGSPYVIGLADNEPVIGTTTQMIGITKSASTHTASVDGTVDVYMLDEGDIELICKATTAANVAATLVGDRVLFDLTSDVWTVDENAGDTATSGLQIIGVNTDTDEIIFKVRPGALEGPVA